MRIDLAKRGARADRKSSEVRAILRGAGLRPTRQRVALAEILFSDGNRHISAEGLHEEAMTHGLLREVVVDGSKTYFDTNTDDHHHFFIEGENRIVDIPVSGLRVEDLPEPIPGMEIARVDIIVRLRRAAD